MRPVSAALVLVPVLGVLAYAPAALAQETQSFDATNLELTRLVGLVEVQTGGVDRITVEYDPGESLVDAPEFEVSGDELQITQLGRRNRVNCRARNNNDLELEVERDGFHDIADYGRYVIRAPESVELEIRGGGIAGTVGNVAKLELGADSCGDITVGDVAADADVAVNGSADVVVGAVGGSLDLAINGSGDVVIGPVSNGADLAINGSGDVEIASLSGGDLNAAINGSGDVSVLGGEVGSVDAAIMGSGDVRFDGVAGRVNLSAFGSGDVYVAEATGTVRTSAFGSGRVHVGED